MGTPLKHWEKECLILWNYVLLKLSITLTFFKGKTESSPDQLHVSFFLFWEIVYLYCNEKMVRLASCLALLTFHLQNGLWTSSRHINLNFSRKHLCWIDHEQIMTFWKILWQSLNTSGNFKTFQKLKKAKLCFKFLGFFAKLK